MLEIKNNLREIGFEQIIELYNSVNWTAYTENPVKLKEALLNSSYVVYAIQDKKLVGLARSISDGVSIHYLQDILVHPDFHKQGIGRKLLENCLENFKEVRTHMILTDDEEKQIKFYESLGYTNTKNTSKIPLNAFVKMKDLNPSDF
jgi:ribosomal protein S18 acetylase RimI-like enzyme